MEFDYGSGMHGEKYEYKCTEGQAISHGFESELLNGFGFIITKANTKDEDDNRVDLGNESLRLVYDIDTDRHLSFGRGDHWDRSSKILHCWKAGFRILQSSHTSCQVVSRAKKEDYDYF